MKNFFYLAFLGIMCISFQQTHAQQYGRSQRGQRGYTPPSRITTEAHIELKDPHQEVSLMLPKCIEKFKLDDFEQEIIKSLLLKKIENQNLILEDEGNNREDRKTKMIEVNKSFYKDLASILTSDEIEIFKSMDFSETREERKKRKKGKRRKKGN